MEQRHYIEYDGVEYEVKEPTIQSFMTLNLLKDLEDDKNFAITLVSIATGIGEEQIREADWFQVKKASEFLTTYFLELSMKFYKEFTFKDKEYTFIDLENLTFGEFVDIDNFLQREDVYRKSNSNELMALLYREKGKDGKPEKYDYSKVRERSELFRELPMKYYQGAMRFFLVLENILQGNIRYYSPTTRLLMKIRKKLVKVLVSIGDGIPRLYSYLVKIYQKSTKS